MQVIKIARVYLSDEEKKHLEEAVKIVRNSYAITKTKDVRFNSTIELLNELILAKEIDC